jgi:hypothetical protein
MNATVMQPICAFFDRLSLPHALSVQAGEGILDFPSGWRLCVRTVRFQIIYTLTHPDIRMHLFFTSWHAVEAFCEQHPTYLSVHPSSPSTEESSTVSHG